LIDGIDAIEQDVWVRLQFFKGEWFLDTRVGVPYFEEILGQKPRLTAIAGIFRDVIMTTPGITGVLDLDIQFDGATRKLSVSFTGQTALGSFTFDKELIV
jgi:hypothetical protein